MRQWIVGGCAALLVCGAAMAAPAVQRPDIIQLWDQVKPPPPPEVRPVTLDPAKTVLFVMDFNRNSCVPERRARCAAIVPDIKALIARARARNMLVIYTFSPNMTRADLMDEIGPGPDDRVYQQGVDKFAHNDLEQLLRSRGITTIIDVGTSANGAALFAALSAEMHGFDVVVPVDLLNGDDLYQEQMAAWEIVNGPRVRERSTLTRTDMVGF
jgi:nicotinamidase-related amidase